MPSFGLISEGATDAQVIGNIVLGLCDEEPSFREFLPITDATQRGQVASFSNWELVLNYCASHQFEEAFQFVDFIIVHIDTDRCDDAKFGVSKQENGEPLLTRALIERVAQKLRDTIGPQVWEQYGHRVIFAIAVDSIECWLLPLYAPPNKMGKAVNCLDALNTALRRKNKSAINPDDKKPRDYDELSKSYRRAKELSKYKTKNESLAVFVEQLQAQLQVASAS